MQNCDPNGSRTRVAGMKARCPRPLDDRAYKNLSIIPKTDNEGNYFSLFLIPSTISLALV